MLVAFAWGQLYKSEGNKLIVQGGGFSNTLTQYDDFKSGNLFSQDDLDPFSFRLNKFTGTYELTGPNRGTPRTYEADVTYSVGAYGKEQRTTIKVNEPLEIGDSKVYLVSHGYAPVITVRDARGKIVMNKEAVPLLPLDGNVTSSGAIKVMDGYRNAKGEKEQLGFQAFFLPTYGGKGSTMLSAFPALLNPMLALNAYHGDLGVDSGVPQSVYQLNKKKLTEFKDSKGELFKQQLKIGETMTLPGGAGSVTFEGVKEWAGFQVTRQPGSGWALVGAVAAILGLAASLFIQRRRVWVRAVTGDDGVTVVEMAASAAASPRRCPRNSVTSPPSSTTGPRAPPDAGDDGPGADTPDAAASGDAPGDDDPSSRASVPAEGAEQK
ncbi:hypothetical protein GCM10020256_31720 [Streptomyces thermocoprophilus]